MKSMMLVKYLITKDEMWRTQATIINYIVSEKRTDSKLK